MNINLRLNDLELLNEGYVPSSVFNQTSDANLSEIYIQNLIKSATKLKMFQTNLSQQTAGLSHDSRLRINPENVLLSYEEISGLPSSSNFDIWEAIFEIVVAAYKLADAPKDITHSNQGAIFIQKNCLNSVMSALQLSS